MPIEIKASNTIQYSDDGVNSTSQTSPTKIKELSMISAYTGSWRVYFEMSDNFGSAGVGQIYKNGIPYGYQQPSNWGYTSYTQDFTNINIIAGDKIQIYAYAYSIDEIDIKNFRIEFDTVCPALGAQLTLI